MDNFAPKVVDDCYHIYSDGTRLAVLCDTEEDYVFIMNQIAITSLYCNVRILCQEVMRTHFHLIARGAPDKIQKYKREIKRLITRRYNRDGLGDIVKDAIQIAVDYSEPESNYRRIGNLTPKVCWFREVILTCNIFIMRYFCRPGSLSPSSM